MQVLNSKNLQFLIKNSLLTLLRSASTKETCPLGLSWAKKLNVKLMMDGVKAQLLGFGMKGILTELHLMME